MALIARVETVDRFAHLEQIVPKRPFASQPRTEMAHASVATSETEQERYDDDRNLHDCGAE
jgi:hypothetical protein